MHVSATTARVSMITTHLIMVIIAAVLMGMKATLTWSMAASVMKVSRAYLHFSDFNTAVG